MRCVSVGVEHERPLELVPGLAELAHEGDDEPGRGAERPGQHADRSGPDAGEARDVGGGLLERAAGAVGTCQARPHPSSPVATRAASRPTSGT